MILTVLKKKLSYEEAKEFALQHYDEGGDVFYECVEKKEYVPQTKEELLEDFKFQKDLDGEESAAYEWMTGYSK